MDPKSPEESQVSLEQETSSQDLHNQVRGKDLPPIVPFRMGQRGSEEEYVKRLDSTKKLLDTEGVGGIVNVLIEGGVPIDVIEEVTKTLPQVESVTTVEEYLRQQKEKNLNYRLNTRTVELIGDKSIRSMATLIAGVYQRLENALSRGDISEVKTFFNDERNIYIKSLLRNIDDALTPYPWSPEEVRKSQVQSVNYAISDARNYLEDSYLLNSLNTQTAEGPLGTMNTPPPESTSSV